MILPRRKNRDTLGVTEMVQPAVDKTRGQRTASAHWQGLMGAGNEEGKEGILTQTKNDVISVINEWRRKISPVVICYQLNGMQNLTFQYFKRQDISKFPYLQGSIQLINSLHDSSAYKASNKTINEHILKMTKRNKRNIVA